MSEYQHFAERCHESPPEAFLVLGSGLGVLVDRVEAFARIEFGSIPGISASSVVGHRGRWTLGRWADKIVLVSEGRLHYYEGHSWEDVVRPITLAAQLGVRRAILTNAAGGIRDDLEPGTLMPIADHLEWNQSYPWRIPKAPTPYSRRLLEIIVEIGHPIRPGIYAAVTGPSYETPAEIRALRSANADAVGMSTSREIATGTALGLECAAISMITNRAAGLSSGKLDHTEVVARGKASASQLGELIEALLARA